MGREKPYWEIKEEELLAKENAYLEQYNMVEKLFDNDLYFVLIFAILLMLGFNIGFLIGSIL